MPKRPNIESKLISALVNTQDVEAAVLYGVIPDMLPTYGNEYRWLLGYPGTYESQPSVEALTTKFPDFPYSEESKDVAFICDEVKDDHNKKIMIRALKSAGDALREGDNEEAYMHFASVQHPAHNMTYKLKNVLHDFDFLDHYDERPDTVEMPWKTLQKTTGGIGAGDFWVYGARLSQGKSWTLSSNIVHALLEGRRVMMFSCEMPEDQVKTRIHVMMAYELGMKGVRHSDLKARNFDPILYRKLGALMKEKVTGELFVVDTSKGGISTSLIAAQSKGMDLVVVDHLGLLISPFGNRAVEDWRTMAAISNVMKEVAMSNKVPIISAAQINRDGDREGWRPPKVKNLAQSDAIGQDADVVITMKRRSKTVATYSIEKNRHGEASVLFSTRFLPNEGRFEEITLERAKDIAERDVQMEEE